MRGRPLSLQSLEVELLMEIQAEESIEARHLQAANRHLAREHALLGELTALVDSKEQTKAA